MKEETLCTVITNLCNLYLCVVECSFKVFDSLKIHFNLFFVKNISSILILPTKKFFDINRIKKLCRKDFKLSEHEDIIALCCGARIYKNKMIIQTAYIGNISVNFS